MLLEFDIAQLRWRIWGKLKIISFNKQAVARLLGNRNTIQGQTSFPLKQIKVKLILKIHKNILIYITSFFLTN